MKSYSVCLKRSFFLLTDESEERLPRNKGKAYFYPRIFLAFHDIITGLSIRIDVIKFYMYDIVIICCAVHPHLLQTARL